jgi:hypothetical protein
MSVLASAGAALVKTAKEAIETRRMVKENMMLVGRAVD